MICSSGMPLAPSPSFANDFTWTCGLDRALARGSRDAWGEAFRLGRSLSDNRCS